MSADIHVDTRIDVKVVVDSVFRNVIGSRLSIAFSVRVTSHWISLASRQSSVFLLVRALYELPSAL